jgi:hypothetical protein
MPNDRAQWVVVARWLKTNVRRHFIRQLLPPKEKIKHWSKDHKRVLSVLYRAAKATECIAQHLPMHFLPPFVELVCDYLPILVERLRVPRENFLDLEKVSVALVHLPHNNYLTQMVTENGCRDTLEKTTPYGPAVALCGPEGLSMVRSMTSEVASFGSLYPSQVRIDYGIDCPIPETLSQTSRSISTKWARMREQRPGPFWVVFSSNMKTHGTIVPDSDSKECCYASSTCQSWARSISMTDKRNTQIYPRLDAFTIHLRWWTSPFYYFAIHIPFVSFPHSSS